jgi:hypothetical protein
VEPEECSVVAAGILDAAIQLMDQALRRPAVPDGHGERVLAEGALQAPGHRPADDLHGAEVLHRREVEPAPARRDVRDVGEPHRVGHVELEGPVEQVRRDGMRMSRADVEHPAPGLVPRQKSTRGKQILGRTGRTSSGDRERRSSRMSGARRSVGAQPLEPAEPCRGSSRSSAVRRLTRSCTARSPGRRAGSRRAAR